MSHEAVLRSLADAVTRRRLRPLDLAFARFLSERDNQASPAIVLLGALVSAHLADGHPCLDLSLLPALAVEHDWPTEWLTIISDAPLSHSIVFANASGTPESAPLVWDGDRLYLRRYWNYECQVARSIQERIVQPNIVDASLTELLHAFFPESTKHGQPPNWQRVACALSARSHVSVITGGPGTGKTTTVVRLLGILQTMHLRTHDRPLRMRLAAPTGKAAARLNASIASQLSQLTVGDGIRAAIPHEVATLHRLLGARPDSRRFRYNREHRLHLDVLVIDEASMVDLEMMAAVMDALPAHARIVLLGDKDQLSSVEAGAVLGDLCHRAALGHYSASTCAWIDEVSHDDISQYVAADHTLLDQHVAMLRTSHRFGRDSGIGRLAGAVNIGDVHAVEELWQTQHSDISWLNTNNRADALAQVVVDGGAENFLPATDMQTPKGYRHYLTCIGMRPEAHADEAAYQQWAIEVLDAYNTFQLLCAIKHGPEGTEAMNQRIARALLEQGLIASDRGWYEGRPVMVTRNDYSLGLMNGDVGVTLRRRGADGSMRLYVAFAISHVTAKQTFSDASALPIRFVLPSRLSEVDTAFAMTVHKSQGSEFEHTALVLPRQAPASLTRELLYTGITRARRWFTLIAQAESMGLAVRQASRRYSGLSERMSR